MDDKNWFVWTVWLIFHAITGAALLVFAFAALAVAAPGIPWLLFAIRRDRKRIPE